MTRREDIKKHHVFGEDANLLYAWSVGGGGGEWKWEFILRKYLERQVVTNL